MKSLSLRLKIFTVLASLQLCILATGMLPIRGEHSPVWFRKTIWTYERITGAGGGFGFFSPNVSHQLFVRFHITQKSGESFEVALEEVVPREVSVRYGNMVRFFSESYENEKLRRSVAASLTTQIFNRYPDAEKVTFQASIFRFPSLDEFQQGERERIQPIYKITFGKNKYARHQTKNF